jgi:hypothetical protein
LKDLVGLTGITEVKPIYRETNQVHVALVTFRPIGWIAEAFRFPGVYPIGPLEIRDEKVKTSFVGKSGQIRQVPRKDEKGKSEIQDPLAYGCEVFPRLSTLQANRQQRTILTSAYNLGCYDIPRKFDSEQLAKKLNLGRSTVAEHLRKAEQRLIAEAISQ